MLLTGYLAFITFAWVVITIYMLVNTRKISYLKNIQITNLKEQPSVAIIIAVKDEEAEVEKALRSVCELEYDNYRIIVINDRSTDSTPVILNKLAAANPRITILNITELPKGWLGKNNALYQGYLATSEEWLLFTDADILYNKQALKKAMQHVQNRNLDHLTALPEITSPSQLFVGVMNTFAFMLEVRLQPWNAINPKSKASIGVGAFNLVKRTAYEKAGTHIPISLRPDDDLKLGASIKKAGLRQDVVYGDKEISLSWYNNLSEFVNGLMKNTFAVSNYNLFIAIGSALLTLVVFVLPIILMLFTPPIGWYLAAILLLSQVVLLTCKRGIQGKWWNAIIIPFAGLVMVYIIIVSAFKTLKQGGIYWRDSFYALDELKKQK